MNFRIISFYTKNTPYEQEVKKLEKSIKEYEYLYYLYPVDNLGSWDLNTKQKTSIILKALEDFNEDVLIYVDSDALIEGKIQIEEFIADIGVCYFDKNKKTKKPRNIIELLSGTIFLRNNENTKKIIKEWEKQCFLQHNKRKWDQKILEDVIKKNKIAKIQKMPLKYCKIFDAMDFVIGGKIVHYQASRKYKRKIKKI